MGDRRRESIQDAMALAEEALGAPSAVRSRLCRRAVERLEEDALEPERGWRAMVARVRQRVRRRAEQAG